MKNERIRINGQERSAVSDTLISELLQGHHDFRMPCAGRGRCGKCRVKVNGEVNELSDIERKNLTDVEQKNGVRLACQTRILGSCDIWTMETGDSEIVLNGNASAEQQENPMFQNLGAAVDIGTTTLAVSLVHTNGRVAQEGGINPQISFGADVISRIEKSLSGETKQLAATVQEAISQLLQKVCLKTNHHPEEIDTLVITGNTTMLYFLTERSPDSLSKAPFIADWLAGEWMSGEVLNLGCPKANVYLPHCMSAFVGADITTAALATQICKEDKKRLLVDIGTNGEVILWTGKKLLCCSTAAGPAFEGAGLSMGMDARTGAISKVHVQDGRLEVQVIGNEEAIGICGSGVIDAVSCLLENGTLDETGYLEDEEALIAGNVKLTQEDIRKIQLAKSAICAGIESLLNKEGMGINDLDELLVAGGFGSRLNLKNAIRIGLLPQISEDKVTVCGNAALRGAEKLLYQKDLLDEEKFLIKMSQKVDLATDSFFQERYMEGMLFPVELNE